MARDYQPQFGIDSPINLNGKVQLIVSECHNVSPASERGSRLPDDQFRAANVLVNLSAEPLSRQALLPVRNALGFARTSVHFLDDAQCTDVLSRRFHGYSLDFATAVVYVDASASLAVHDVQKIVDSLRDGLGITALRLLVVCGEPSRWKSLRGISGFVRGAGDTGADTAALLFLMMAVEMAPRTLECLDFGDFEFASEHPDACPVLVEAAWVRATRQLIWASDADRDIVAASLAVMAFPLAGQIRLSEVRDISHALRSSMRPDAEMIYGAAVEFDPAGYLHGRIAAVPMLCTKHGLVTFIA